MIGPGSKPRVVLMDLRMPGRDGLAAMEWIRVEQPEVAIVILTTYDEDDPMARGLRAGARGYLLKDTTRQALFDTLRAAARGETLLRPEVLGRVLDRLPAGDDAARASLALTERELEVLGRVAQGEGSKEIAAHLGITERTVKAHLASIYNKLGVDSRAAAIAVASQRGWLR
jgi:NarL family two-component system response regulator YdfI